MKKLQLTCVVRPFVRTTAGEVVPVTGLELYIHCFKRPSGSRHSFQEPNQGATSKSCPPLPALQANTMSTFPSFQWQFSSDWSTLQHQAQQWIWWPIRDYVDQHLIPSDMTEENRAGDLSRERDETDNLWYSLAEIRETQSPYVQICANRPCWMELDNHLSLIGMLHNENFKTNAVC